MTISKTNSAFWSSKKSKKHVCFSKVGLKIATKYLLENCFFTVGNIVVRQKIGIPMGIDPAPFWANLFLYTYEKAFMKKLVKEDKRKAWLLNSTGRFLDDLLTINDNGLFEASHHTIYPEGLELKLEHSGTHASFLNIDITVVENQFLYKLFDKRDTFPFQIVWMPHMNSNIPQCVFYSAIVGEFLRIGRSILLTHDFIKYASTLMSRMKKQGAKHWVLKKHLRKILERHDLEFSKFKLNTEELLEKIL